MDVALFAYIGGEIDGVMNAWLLSTIGLIITGLAPIVVAAVVIYIMHLGWQVMVGKGSFENFASIALRALVVTAIAGSAANYQEFIQGGIQSVETGLVSLSGVGSTSTAGTPAPVTTTYGVLDRAISSAFTAANRLNAVKETGIFNLGHNLVVTLSQIAVIAAIGLMTLIPC